VLRFHLDENVDPAIAHGLRNRGVDVTTSDDQGLNSADDDAHLRFGQAEGRVIVTHDEDFLKLAADGASHAGIAYCHIEARTIGEIVRYLDLMADCLTPEDMHDRVEFI
jgi:predicted nuclease of predicted toxin-antitoxin system